MRDWQVKLQSGEYVHNFRGYAPHWAGCFYGDSHKLGGEEKFSHCYDFFSGIGDVDWWIVAELNKHTKEELDQLELICARNKWVKEKILSSNVVTQVIKILGCPSHSFYRLGSACGYEYIRTILTRYVRYSHIKLPKIEDITVEHINTIDLSQDLALVQPSNINGTFLDPIITLRDIETDTAYLPKDILELVPTLKLVSNEREGFRMSLIKAKTTDQKWLDSFKLAED